jgi:hypothetical protein
MMFLLGMTEFSWVRVLRPFRPSFKRQVLRLPFDFAQGRSELQKGWGTRQQTSRPERRSQTGET